MSDLKIDTHHLKKIVEAIEHIAEHLQEESKILLDEDEDVFVRYMAYGRLASIAMSFENVAQVSRNMFRLGHDLKHDVFHTKQFNKKGWNKDKIAGNPFFENEDEDDDEEENCPEGIAIKGSDLPKEARDMLAKIIMSSIKSMAKKSK